MSDYCCSRRSAAVTDNAHDPATARVLERVRDLVDGNRVSRDEVEVVDGGASDHRLNVHLTVTGFFRTRHAETRADYVDPPGGRRVSGGELVKDAGRAAYDATRQTPDFEIEARALVERDPIAALNGGSRESTLYKNVQTIYFHERHQPCRGEGWTLCTICHDGKRPCMDCRGSGRQEIARQGINGVEHETVNCPSCSGRGRSGSCPNCTNRRVHCRECAGTGGVTQVCHTEVGVEIRTHAEPAEGAPAAFKRHFAGLDSHGLTRDADVAYRHAEGGGGSWTFRFDGTAPYARADVRAGDLARFTVEAAGKRLDFVDPPAFLDTLIDPVRERIVAASGPDACFEAARETRLTREVLAMCAKRGANDVDAFVQHRRGCVSKDLVHAVSRAVDRQYDRAGASAVVGTWLAVLPLLAAAGAATLLTGWAGHLGGAPEGMTLGEVTMIAALLVVAAGWIAGHRVAARRGRAKIQALLGGATDRAPQQPVLLAGFSPLVLMLALGGFGATLYTAPNGIGPPHRTGVAEKLEFLFDREAGRPARAGAHADGGPRIDPPANAVVNDPHVYRLQYRLDRLGHYTGNIDGLDGPKTRAAIARFHAANPELDATVDPRRVARQAARVIRAAR